MTWPLFLICFVAVGMIAYSLVKKFRRDNQSGKVVVSRGVNALLVGGIVIALAAISITVLGKIGISIPPFTHDETTETRSEGELSGEMAAPVYVTADQINEILKPIKADLDSVKVTLAGLKSSAAQQPAKADSSKPKNDSRFRF